MYNERVVQGSIRPNLVDMFLDVAKQLDDKVRQYTAQYFEIIVIFGILCLSLKSFEYLFEKNSNNLHMLYSPITWEKNMSFMAMQGTVRLCS